MAVTSPAVVTHEGKQVVTEFLTIYSELILLETLRTDSISLYPYFTGCLYVCGGAVLEDGDGIDLVQRYDSKTNEWTEVASMLIPRSGSAACVLGGYIYVIGKA